MVELLQTVHDTIRSHNVGEWLRRTMKLSTPLYSGVLYLKSSKLDIVLGAQYSGVIDAG
jgi:hypothetical protein